MDYLDFVYETKRALYLTVVASLLKKQYPEMRLVNHNVIHFINNNNNNNNNNNKCDHVHRSRLDKSEFVHSALLKRVLSVCNLHLYFTCEVRWSG